jgi:hypothetical protein
VLIWRASCVAEEERKERGEAEAAASAMLADDLGRHKRCTTEEGKTYYIDRHSKTTSWTLYVWIRRPPLSFFRGAATDNLQHLSTRL